MFRILAFLCVFCLGVPQAVWPAESDEVLEIRRELEEMRRTLQQQNDLIQRQQRQINDLENRLSPAASPAPVPANPAGQAASLLSEIGVIGDIVATTSEDKADAEGNDRVAVRELELIVGSNVDPYSRFDANISFSDFEEVSVEEAYLTRWGLPFDLTGRFGRFFPKVGKQASIHRDSLPTVDEPLVIRRYFGAEGYNRTGADLSRIFEGPASWVFQPSFGVLEGGVGEGGSVFGGTRRRPVIYSHFKAHKDLSDSSGFELGGTHLAGSSDADSEFEVNVFGVDATYLNNLTPTTKLLLQSELFVQHRDESFSVADEMVEGVGPVPVVTSFNRHPWGAYFLADYRFAPRWSVGGRVDHARLSDTPGRSFDQGLSAFLTFYQSEWARWRLQYRHEERATEPTDDAVFLQGTFAIGTHKHKIQ